MRGVAPHRAFHCIPTVARRRHAAAGAVYERRDTVDVGIIGKAWVAVDRIGHEPGDRRGTVHAGQHRDVVARANLAIRPAIALERRLLRDGQDVCRLGVGPERIVAVELGIGAVVCVNVVTRDDVLAGKADDLAELQDRLTLRDPGDRHFVALEHAPGYGHAIDGRARRQPVDGNDDVILRIEPQRARAGAVIEHGVLRRRSEADFCFSCV
jgi:hypothetical protein